MNKILLDFGANKGQGLKKIIEIESINEQWKIYSFEPNPILFEKLKENFKNSNLNINFQQKAIWKMNGKIDFSIMNENDEGSCVERLISEGRASDPNDPCYRKHNNIIKVESVDILDLLNQFDDTDFIVIKMDIEGSEFSTLRRLLEDKESCKKIKKMHIEWHTSYIKNESEITKKQIISELNNLNIILNNNW